MPAERANYHMVFTATHGKPVFLTGEIDAAFKTLVRHIAGHRTGT